MVVVLEPLGVENVRVLVDAGVHVYGNCGDVHPHPLLKHKVGPRDLVRGGHDAIQHRYERVESQRFCNPKIDRRIEAAFYKENISVILVKF